MKTSREIFFLLILFLFASMSFGAPASYVIKPDDQERLEKATSLWGTYPKAIVFKMVEKYGYPSEVTLTRVTWFNNGIWKRSSVYKEEVEHNFPRKHFDVLEQTIEFRVPSQNVSDLVEFNGSLLFDRTKGELTSKAESEMSNILALNLAVDIIEGQRSIRQAREAFAWAYDFILQGKMPDEFSNLRFRTPNTKTADPDILFQPINLSRAVFIK